MKNHKDVVVARAGRTDGRLFPVTPGDVVRGAVLRMVSPGDASVPAFSDFVVVDVTPAIDEGEVPTAKLARPYAFLSHPGTVCPTVLTGVEYLEVPVARLTAEDSNFSAVVQSTGLVATHTMGIH